MAEAQPAHQGGSQAVLSAQAERLEGADCIIDRVYRVKRAAKPAGSPFKSDLRSNQGQLKPKAVTVQADAN